VGVDGVSEEVKCAVDFDEGLWALVSEDVTAELPQSSPAHIDGVGFDRREGRCVGFWSSSAVVPTLGVKAVADGECGVDGVASSVHEAGGFVCQFGEFVVRGGVVRFDDFALLGGDAAAKGHDVSVGDDSHRGLVPVCVGRSGGSSALVA
jgi:hypothetical protein